MAARVNIPGIGPTYFDDSMSDDEIHQQVEAMQAQGRQRYKPSDTSRALLSQAAGLRQTQPVFTRVSRRTACPRM